MANASTSRVPTSRLDSPVLHVYGLAQEVQDEEIVSVLSECLRLRLNLDRRGNASFGGTIEFESLHNAEKAYATTNEQVFAQHAGASLSLSLSPLGPTHDPRPLAQPRLIKSLPRSFSAGRVFDLCREFGPIHSATLRLAPAFPPGSGPPTFKGQALVTFYDEDDAQKMMHGLQYLEVEGVNIIVTLWDPKRAERPPRPRRSDVSERSLRSSPNSSSPVQNSADRTSRWANSTTTTTTGSKYPSTLSASTPEFVSPAMSRNVSGASQWSNTTGDTSHGEGGSPKASKRNGGPSAGMTIDPCNLFVKSLESSLSSEHLHGLFAQYGEIVSARVMYDPVTSRSKEFGFVSFKQADQAAAAQRAMDGQLVGTKHITVRLHEPKKLRESRASMAGTGPVSATSERRASAAVERVAIDLEQLSTDDHQPVWQPSNLPAGTESADASSEPTRASPTSEHERLLVAVREIESARALEIVTLIESLPRKEQVMCLFNPEVLARKVADAVVVLEASEGSDQEAATSSTPHSSSLANSNGVSPELAAARSPTAIDGVPATISLLAKLPAAEIVPVLPEATLVLGLSTPTDGELEATKEFMDSLDGSPIGQVKQKLGERLFKVVKKTGIKRSPKTTIDLLDSEDLRSLSVLLHYPEILKEKALLLSSKP